MNLFSSKEQVDSHVRKLLTITKNEHDINLQCKMIAKYYCDVKEYQIALNYIDRFLKTQENSQSGLRLKGLINENLREFDAAGKCYERLYDMYGEEYDLSKACECLCQSDNANENKLKKFLEILERNAPQNEFYFKLQSKLSPNASFNYSREEINSLKKQMKTNVNDDCKIRFLRILDSQANVVDSLTECCSLIDNYSVLNNDDAVAICLSIFKKFYCSDNRPYKSYYCLILIASLKNRRKICSFDLDSYLNDLVDLIHEEHFDGIYQSIFRLFAYFISSFAHNKLFEEKRFDSELKRSIIQGYSLSIETDRSVEYSGVSPIISSWLREQISLVKTISNRMMKLEHPDMNNDKCFATLGRLIWPNLSNQSSENRLIGINKKFPTRSLSSEIDCLNLDSQLLVRFFSDLKLIEWHILGRTKTTNESNKVMLSREVCSFLEQLVTRMFTKVSSKSSANKKIPENISQTDLLVFLLSVARKIVRKSVDSNESEFPIPFGQRKVESGEMTCKWWYGAIDFTLNNKKHTSIGALRDLLKIGLESLQPPEVGDSNTSNQLSDIARLILGQLLNECSNFIGDYDLKNSLKLRSIEFFLSSLNISNKNNNDKLLFKSLPMRINHQSPMFANRQSSLPINQSALSPSSGKFINELFDTDELLPTINDADLDQMKISACLSIIDFRLDQQQQQPFINFNELDQVLEIAQKLIDKSSLKFFSSLICLRKSRVYMSRARRSEFDQSMSSGEINRLVKLARDSANEGMDCVPSLRESDKSKIHEQLQKQLNLISTWTPPVVSGDYSVFELSRDFDTSFTNKFINNHSMSMMDNGVNAFVFERLDKLQSDIASICYTQTKMENNAKLMENKVRAKEKKLEKEKLSRRNDIYQLNVNIDNLTSQLQKLELQVEISQNEIEYLKQNNESLTKSLNELTLENSLLKCQCEHMEKVNDIQKKIINPEIGKLNSLFENRFQNIYNNLNQQIIQLDVKKNIQLLYKNMESEEYYQSSDVIDALENKEMKNGETIDSSIFSENKWQCPTCGCMNEESYTTCPSCQTIFNQNMKNIEMNVNSFLDFSKFNKNKWECSACCCMNDTNLSNCPACGHPNPLSTKISNPVSNQGSVNKSNPLGFGTSVEPIRFGTPTLESKTTNTSTNQSFSFGTSKPFTFFNKPSEINKNIGTQKIDEQSNLQKPTLEKENNANSVMDFSKFNKDKYACPGCYCMNDTNLSNCPACATPNPLSTKISNPVSIPFSVNKSNPLAFGTSVEPIRFGVTNTGSKLSSEKTNTSTNQSFSFGTSKPFTFLNQPSTFNKDIETQKIDNLINSQQPQREKENNATSVMDFSKFNKDKWACSTCYCMNDSNLNNCPACATINPQSIKNSSGISFPFSLGIGANTETIRFGSTDNKSVFGFDNTRSANDTLFSFGTSTSETLNSVDKSLEVKVNKSDKNWNCECTTVNKPDRTECIACDLKKTTLSEIECDSKSVDEGDRDSDVIFVSEPYVTEEQIARARALLLPDHFYYFENLPETNDDDEDEDEEGNSRIKEENNNIQEQTKANEPMLLFPSLSAATIGETNFKFTFSPITNGKSLPVTIDNNGTLFSSTNINTNVNISTFEENEENPEDFNADYEPIISLPEKIDVITGEENAECIFNKRCKLFRFVVDTWKERGVGEMKILQFENEKGKSYRLMMRREQVHKVCCNQTIFKTCPNFIDLEKSRNSTCWFAEDFSEGTALEKVKFAIRFKLETDLKEFKDIVQSLQDQL